MKRASGRGTTFYWVEKSLSRDLSSKLGMKDKWRYGMIVCEEAVIKSMPTSPPNTVDRLVWLAMKSGSYIVKLGYHATIYSSQHHHYDEANNFHVVCDVIWKIIWGARPFLKLKTSCG
ncbi:unnamed protein product [Prunus armeniaca]|uniref:Uncharacterized protein n=1 Tax=Prunus armeniaca TaxID=36596 RepID=A0A6J5TL35_PRUAR|nr:unnamed protein product [Prunus armeniaca]CAB4294006.1 unnamed protein product [Prunus armeniaca]